MSSSQACWLCRQLSKDFINHGHYVIDSWASCNYVRRHSEEGYQQYAEALKTREGDSITVHFATGVRVTVYKFALNLDVKFVDFNSVKRCLVLDLDSRYDLILGMTWLECHESWLSKNPRP